ncbi:hypothetical protein C7445_10881 [Alicyclobacillus sacchari]|uniref:Uncharacterized protein n=1 Tax=Alicyclobacillus sacchari TaxID=392010 RepID=A0A4R8LL49_9BACL|nr:hypothetical protein [Alicyclobacillus sacchari]TDY45258.1 hypothetical protein C7445_10881 [Alicyclobacillus sacchari]
MNFENAPLSPILERIEATADMICTFDHRLSFARTEHGIEVTFRHHTGAVAAVVLAVEAQTDAIVQISAIRSLDEDRATPTKQSVYRGTAPGRALDDATTAWLATWYGDCVRQLST